MTDISDSGLPPVQRVVTGHDANGRAVFKSEDVAPTRMIPSGDAAFLLLWTTATVPADNNDETDGRYREAGLTLEGGSVIRVVDMLPGGESPIALNVPRRYHSFNRLDNNNSPAHLAATSCHRHERIAPHHGRTGPPR